MANRRSTLVYQLVKFVATSRLGQFTAPESAVQSGCSRLSQELLDKVFDWRTLRSVRFSHGKTGLCCFASRLKPPWLRAEFAPFRSAAYFNSSAASEVQSDRVTELDYTYPAAEDIGRLCKQGRLKEAMAIFEVFEEGGIRLHSELIVQLLHECARKKSVADGKRVHSYVVKTRLESSPFLAGHLVRMFANCGRMVNAREVFDSMPKQSVFSWTALMKGYLNHGQGMEALRLFKQMQSVGVKPDKFVFVIVLNACARLADLDEGRRVHEYIISSGSESDVYVDNALIDMYAKCTRIKDARQVFDTMQRRDVVSWNAMISGYARCRLGKEGFKLFEQMEQHNMKPNAVTFASVLNGCARRGDLEVGREVHFQIKTRKLDSDVFVGTALVDMYAKCGMMEEAFEAFCRMPERGIATWNSMLKGFLDHGQSEDTLRLFGKMLLFPSLQPDALTFVSVVKACGSLPVLDEGKLVHSLISKKGFDSDVYVGNALMDMYANFGRIEEALDVFDKLPSDNVSSWNGILKAYVRCSIPEMALDIFQKMQQKGVDPNRASYISALNACGNTSALEDGERIHRQVDLAGLDSDVFVGAALIDMYSKCGKTDLARQVFDKLSKQDVVLWTVMIKGYTQQGLGEDALQLFKKMLEEKVEPDGVTFVSVLKACVTLGDLEEGRRLHVLMMDRGHGKDAFLANALIDMYAKCGSAKDSYMVFQSMPRRDVVSWNCMIKGFAHLGQGKKALELFHRMRQDGFRADTVTFISVLNACASIGALEAGSQIHAQIRESGCETDTSIGNCLMVMYSKCGDLQMAQQVFNNMVVKDAVSWSTLIAGYAQQGFAAESLKVFKQMLEGGPEPNTVALVCALNACASLVALDEGKQIHALISNSDFQSNIYVGNALVDMYAKCGKPEDARRVLDMMPERDVVSWNTMIAGYGLNGLGRQALNLFEEMRKQHVKLNHITFISLLSSCSHTGLTDEGLHYFASMEPDHGISPTTEHYTCLVDLLGRAGRLDEAEQAVLQMPYPSTAAGWLALLGASRIHGDAEFAQRAAEHVMKIEPENASAYLLLAQTYAALGQTDKEEEVRRLMLERGVQRTAACSWVEVNNEVHQFVASDRSHHGTHEIYAEVDRLSKQMQSVDDLPDTTSDPHHHFGDGKNKDLGLRPQ